MDDRQVIEAFLEGSTDASGPALHIEGDALLVAGWWHGAFRLMPEAIIVRRDSPPEDLPVIDDLQEALARRGLSEIPGDHPLIEAITYTELTTAGLPWRLWATNAAVGEAAIIARAGAESMPRDWTPEDAAVVEGMSSQLEGARRIAGLPPSLIVAIGLPRDVVYALEASVPECRFEARGLGEIAPEACGDLGPALALVDATGRAGREFIMELRAAACGRFLPVAAVVEGASAPAGADVALDVRTPPPTWREALLRLLP